jgi:hypothetical protein
MSCYVDSPEAADDTILDKGAEVIGLSGVFHTRRLFSRSLKVQRIQGTEVQFTPDQGMGKRASRWELDVACNAHTVMAIA